MSTNEEISENEDLNPEQPDEATDDISLEQGSDYEANASAQDDGTGVESDPDRDGPPPSGSNDRPIIIN